MSKKTNIRCFDYVNHSYDKVCHILLTQSEEVFSKATRSAETRAESVASGLHVKVAGIEVGKEILIDVRGYSDLDSKSKKELTISLTWKAASAPQFFPTMNAELHAYPITSSETQLDFHGDYEPPLGIVGQAINAMVGHRIAEATVHHFVSEVASYLRDTIE